MNYKFLAMFMRYIIINSANMTSLFKASTERRDINNDTSPHTQILYGIKQSNHRLMYSCLMSTVLKMTVLCLNTSLQTSSPVQVQTSSNSVIDDDFGRVRPKPSRCVAVTHQRLEFFACTLSPPWLTKFCVIYRIQIRTIRLNSNFVIISENHFDEM